MATRAGGETTIGHKLSTHVGDVVVLEVDLEGPYGMRLGPDTDGHAAIIRGWEKVNNRFGPVQRHGGVRVGDVLAQINDTQLDSLPHQQVLRVLNNRNMLRKVLRFKNADLYYREKRRARDMPATTRAVAANFRSTVRRAQTTDAGSGLHAEYEVTCQYRMVSNRVEKESVRKWSVWRRFSQFSELDRRLRQAYGWQMESIPFPPSHTFAFNKLSPEFLERRCSELDEYWQRVLTIERVADFQKHDCSADLKAFLDVDNRTRVAATTGEGAGGVAGEADGNEEAAAAAPAAADEAPTKGPGRQSRSNTRRSRRRTIGSQSSRRSSLNAAAAPEDASAAAATTPAASTAASADAAAPPAKRPAPPPKPEGHRNSISAGRPPPPPPPKEGRRMSAPPAMVPPAGAAAPAPPAPPPAPAPPAARPQSGPPPGAGNRSALFAQINSMRKG